jgi:hypothetical protein
MVMDGNLLDKESQYEPILRFRIDGQPIGYNRSFKVTDDIKQNIEWEDLKKLSIVEYEPTIFNKNTKLVLQYHLSIWRVKKIETIAFQPTDNLEKINAIHKLLCRFKETHKKFIFTNESEYRVRNKSEYEKNIARNYHRLCCGKWW